MSSTFASLGTPADLVAALDARGITSPFEVQAAAIPDALAGRDVCGRAPTGSGKTLAFGIPLCAKVQRAEPRKPSALVLVPTRELAAQIQRDLEPLAAVRKLHVMSVYGGVGYGPQRSGLRRGVDVLVACPGRLEDLIEQHAVSLDRVEIVVIDEADRMADMGFLPAVRRLLDQTSRKRQTLLFSATLDGDVAKLTAQYQTNPVRHEVGDAEPDLSSVRHCFWKLDPRERVAHTADVVRAIGPTIVFCRTRHGADRVTKALDRAGVSAAAIHGGRTQAQRDRALAGFAAGRVFTLVATDVAARGIHVDGVAGVVHFDLPEDHKAYVHRSGRTARAGASGVVVTFVSPDRIREAKRLVQPIGIVVEATAPNASSLGPGGFAVAGHSGGVGPAGHNEPKGPKALGERPRGPKSQRSRPGGAGRNGRPRSGHRGQGSSGGVRHQSH